jgi:hypothetical protein
LRQFTEPVLRRLVPIKSVSSQKALQVLHVRPRTSSAGTYHHPFVSYFGVCSGYHACGTSRTSFHCAPRIALRKLCSAVIPNSLWHLSSRASVFHPRTWALNLRCSPSGQPSILVGTKSTSVTSSIHCSPRVWKLRHFVPGDWRCPVCWYSLGIRGKGS